MATDTTSPTEPSDESGASACSTIFAERDTNIKLLGFQCYSDYLASDLWAWIRATLDDPKRCICCQSKTGLAWHHRCYTLPVLIGNFSEQDGGNDYAQIVRVCRDCHRAIHFSIEKKWLDLSTCNQRLRELFNRKALYSCFDRTNLPGDHPPDWSEFDDHREFTNQAAFGNESSELKMLQNAFEKSRADFNKDS